MRLQGLSGAFKEIIFNMQNIVSAGGTIIPIMSFNAYNIDTRFGKAQDYINQIEDITKHKIINTFVETERIGQKKLLDILIIAPCTGNTIAKLVNGITDTPVLMASKSSLRNNNSIVIGISTNDGLSTSASNIGRLLNTKNFYFVPFRQDNPITKPNSLVFDSTYLTKTIEFALNKKQIQPVLV